MMKRLALAAALAVVPALAGCGHSDSANAPASADNVEMPAEEALSGVVATPSADATATATDAGSDAGSGGPDDGGLAASAGSGAGPAAVAVPNAASSAASSGGQ